MTLADTTADAGDAFGKLVRRYQDAAFAAAYAILKDPAAPEDATQAAFLAAWLRRNDLSRSPDSRRLAPHDRSNRVRPHPSAELLADRIARRGPSDTGQAASRQSRQCGASRCASIAFRKHRTENA